MLISQDNNQTKKYDNIKSFLQDLKFRGLNLKFCRRIAKYIIFKEDIELNLDIDKSCNLNEGDFVIYIGCRGCKNKIVLSPDDFKSQYEIISDIEAIERKEYILVILEEKVIINNEYCCAGDYLIIDDENNMMEKISCNKFEKFYKYV